MSVYLCPSAKQQYLDANGNPLAGGKLYTYHSGTSNPQATYTDENASAYNSNPVILNSRGEASIFWLNDVYSIRLTDSDDNLIYTQDGVTPAFAGNSLSYKGVWDADTNTPAIVSSIGSPGEYYIVNVNGSTSIDGTAVWNVGDWVVFGTTTWQRVPLSTLSIINGGVYA